MKALATWSGGLGPHCAKLHSTPPPLSQHKNPTDVSTLAPKAPSNGGFDSTTVDVLMEVHRRNWLCLIFFRPLYVCGKCHKTVHLCCMHCEGCGFCLHTLKCLVCGKGHRNTCFFSKVALGGSR